VAISQVSVIIPTLNRVDTLRRALDSVISQTYKAHSIVVIDDGSTDGTSDMINKYYPQIIFIRQDNQGVSAARNTGINSIDAEWIAFLDSDDEWLPRKLEKQMTSLNNNKKMKICHTDEIWIRNGIRVNPMKKHAKSGGWIFQKCLPLCCVSPSSVLLKKTIFDHVGLFDESLPACEDYDLWLRISIHYPFLYIDEQLLTKYGGHNDQLSKKYWGMDRFRIKALKKILKDSSLNKSDRKAAEKMLKEKIHIFSEGAYKRGKNVD
tara:strand:+ start:9897 stop:10688 length:792 start_codon:yes stop_codon:yes gene_type:complete